MMWLLITRARRHVAWALTRIPPSTPADHADRYRSWQHGIEGEAAWPHIEENAGGGRVTDPDPTTSPQQGAGVTSAKEQEQ